MLTLSPDQKHAHDTIMRWYSDSHRESQYMSLGGYAGTGKSTLVAHLRKSLGELDAKLKVGFVSYTGKAARVLKNKLRDQDAIQPGDTVGTIHSLIYTPLMDDKENIIGWDKKETIDRTLLIVDEGSMVDERIWTHLLSYRVPILVVGDHGQLPPIQGSFSLMSDPHIRLDHIHRQAAENPIIELSIQAREHGVIRMGTYSDTVIKYDMASSDSQDSMQELLAKYDNQTLVLCGFNATRSKLNKHIRGLLGFESSEPVRGDRVICLRNNNKVKIANGMLGTIRSIEPMSEDWYVATIAMDDMDKVYSGRIAREQFGATAALNFTSNRAATATGDLFDFGYATTVHKAQGSQAKRVILFEERSKHMDDLMWRRWLYTGITRAEDELYVFGREMTISNPNMDS
ncbi:MAG: AAA family ATPase [Candidatus Roizmanbacteria bacterium]